MSTPLLPVGPNEQQVLLPKILAADASDSGAQRALQAFEAHLRAATLEALVFRSPTRPDLAIAVVPLPGGVIWISLPASILQPSDDVDPLAALTLDVCRHFARRGDLYAQVLLAPEAAAAQRAALRAGFDALTHVLYLEARTQRVHATARDDQRLRWEPYTPERLDEFVAVLQCTYQDSLDFPELNRFRTARDSLALHRASGVFRPELWQIGFDDASTPVACLLMTYQDFAGALEVTYMGLAPHARGKRLGSACVARASHEARRVGAPRMTLVVDVRNAPARRLYASAGLREIAQRAVFLRDLRDLRADAATHEIVENL